MAESLIPVTVMLSADEAELLENLSSLDKRSKSSLLRIAFLQFVGERSYTCYAMKNKKNGKYYVGSTYSLEQRIRSHFDFLKKGKHHNILLQKDYIEMELSQNDFEIFVLQAGMLEPNRKEAELSHMLELQSHNPEYGYNVNDVMIRRMNKQKATPITIIDAKPK